MQRSEYFCYLRNGEPHLLELVRAGIDFGHSTEHRDMGMVEHQDFVGGLGDILHAVGNEDNGAPRLIAISADKRENDLSAARVETCGRLIEDEHFGLHRHNARYRGAAFFAALTNRNSLLVRMPYEKNGGAGVRTVTYMRSSGFLPPTLENVMTGEPEKSLIFFWRDPPAEVTEPLSVIPMNALEPNGQNKLLLVGRWYETDIQFSVGTPVLNDDGTQQSWISEKVVYEGKIKINEPLFFSLTIPEDTARVCLFMKRPWDVSWFTWPITDQAPFYVSGDTFLTGGS